MKYAAFAVGLALGLTLPAGFGTLRTGCPPTPGRSRFKDAASQPAIPEHGSLPRNIIMSLADGLGFPHLTAAEVVLGASERAPCGIASTPPGGRGATRLPVP